MERNPAVVKMLKPERWQALFDGEGRVLGFQKALKLVCMGGVDPSIRAEVWEFLLGCYALSSPIDFREKLRAARRKRYEELVKECQKMHESIGTGMLAFVVGSKVMDMRTYSRDLQAKEPEGEVVETKCGNNNGVCQMERFSDSSDNVSVRQSVDEGENQFDLSDLSVTNLVHKDDEVEKEREMNDGGHSTQSRLDSEIMHSSQISNDEDIIIESNGSLSDSGRDSFNSENDTVCIHGEAVLQSDSPSQHSSLVNTLRISSPPETARMVTSTSLGEAKVSEWLWTLHSIVVDVVRTDNHLQFFEDQKNLARMSDMLAIYAWIDPQIGYCQGMSDLLSPFLVLFENDADAFWCFERLLRRLRDNFRMEGSSGVMQQLHTLWQILELTDKEMYSHLAHIGAEGLHFAFRMLHVLFRRELSFSEVLCMWEMMWAADFDESMDWNLEENCLEPLLLQLPRDTDSVEETVEFDEGLKAISQGKLVRAEYSMSGIIWMTPGAFCGLTESLWPRTISMHSHRRCLSSRNVEIELPVFCVAAILIFNRQKIFKEARCMDDLIKAVMKFTILTVVQIFNDNMLKIKVRRSVRTAVKLRKKYFYKMAVKKSMLGRSVSLG
ncbi:hypothetical protein V2J09_003303 [Rumex salicifolius]